MDFANLVEPIGWPGYDREVGRRDIGVELEPGFVLDGGSAPR